MVYGIMGKGIFYVRKSKAASVQDLGEPRGLQENKAARIFKPSARDGNKIISPTHRPSLPSKEDPWYLFLLQAESTQGWW
jgi:hypothetical protein